VGSKFEAELDLVRAKIDKDLFMRSANGHVASFKDVDLRGAKIGDQLSMIGAIFSGKLEMDGIQIAGHLFMRSADGNVASFKDVVLRGAKIGGQLSMSGAKVTGQLNMQSAQIGEALFLRDGEFASINLTRAIIDSHVLMEKANFKGPVIMTGAQIKGDLVFDTKKDNASIWGDGSILDLRNLRVGALQAGGPEVWPKKENLYLDGLIYERLGGVRINDARGMGHWTGKEYVDWLSRMKILSLQPYELTGKILREMGRKGEAEEVLLAGRERLREQEGGVTAFLLNYLIGHGFAYGRALFWVAVMTMLGALLIFVSPSNRAVPPLWLGEPTPPPGWTSHKVPDWLVALRNGLARFFYSRFSRCIFYSFEMLIPLVKLCDAHSKHDPRGLVRYYFYFHRMFGWVLASFIVAGVTGLVK
jgi:hypothetical protein